MRRNFRIGDKDIGDETASYVIAEVGHNHQGDVEKCKQIFKAAAETGADAVKLQKRDNKTLFTRQMYDSHYDSENAYGPTYGLHRERLEFNADQYLELRHFAEKLGLMFFSTAFDVASAELLHNLEMPAYKIASGDLTNVQLLKIVAAFGKPMIISTGGGTIEDVRRAYEAIMPINSNLCIMQCTSGYPPAHEELNLRVIETFRREFPDVVIGFSSHDSGVVMPIVGYMLGARIFEKHFTLNRAWKGTDQAFSLEPAGLRRVVRDLDRTRMALGDGRKNPYESEIEPLNKMIKRVVAARHLKAGDRLEPSDIALRIPTRDKITSEALRPFEAEALFGKALTRDIPADEIVTVASVD